MVSAGFYKPQNISLSDNIGAAAAKVSSNIQSLMALAIVVILVLFAGVVASGQLIQARVLASIVLCFVNNLLCGFGMLMVAVSIYIFVKNGAVLAGAYDLMGYMLGMALLFIVVAIAGHCAVRNKSFPLLMVYIFFSLALLGACMGGVWLAFNNSAAVVTWVSNADDNMISSVANSLYLSSNKAGIITGIKGNMQKIGLAFGVLLILQALSLVCAAVFGWAANNWRIEYGVRLEGGPGLAARLRQRRLSLLPTRLAHPLPASLALATLPTPHSPPPLCSSRAHLQCCPRTCSLPRSFQRSPGRAKITTTTRWPPTPPTASSSSSSSSRLGASSSSSRLGASSSSSSSSRWAASSSSSIRWAMRAACELPSCTLGRAPSCPMQVLPHSSAATASRVFPRLCPPPPSYHTPFFFPLVYLFYFSTTRKEIFSANSASPFSHTTAPCVSLRAMRSE